MSHRRIAGWLALATILIVGSWYFCSRNLDQYEVSAEFSAKAGSAERAIRDLDNAGSSSTFYELRKVEVEKALRASAELAKTESELNIQHRLEELFLAVGVKHARERFLQSVR